MRNFFICTSFLILMSGIKSVALGEEVKLSVSGNPATDRNNFVGTVVLDSQTNVEKHISSGKSLNIPIGRHEMRGEYVRKNVSTRSCNLSNKSGPDYYNFIKDFEYFLTLTLKPDGTCKLDMDYIYVVIAEE